MREAGENYLKNYSKFISVEGSSEHTTLPDSSIDIIIAGQSYHWFNPEESKTEFKRILNNRFENMNCLLVWNTRKIETSYGTDLEDLVVKYSIDYDVVKHKDIRANKINKSEENIFFGEFFSKKIFPNNQKLDFNNILGRLLSSSYMIQTSHKKYPTLKNDLELIFNKHNVNGYINFEYNTEVYTGKL